MIKASELRIGNYLERMDGSIFQFNCDDFSLIEKTPIKPYSIPLTEEWLLKFGAVRFGGDLGWNCNNHLICWAECRKVFIHSSTSVELKYVHQWQNLFFALTGEELSISGTK